MRIGFVCTNFNNAAYTRALVTSLARPDSAGNVHVVIVDNDSQPSDVAELERLAQELSWVDLVRSGENVGYFPGLNIGICHIRRGAPDIQHVVVGNNDLVFPADFVASVQRHREVFERWAVVAPDLVTPEGAHQNPHVAHPIGPIRRLIWDLHYASYGAALCVRVLARATWRLTARPENRPGHGLHDQAGPIEQAYGACYLLGPLFFEHFNRLFAPTFLLQEEYFLNEQLRTVDQRTYYEPGIVVQHSGHATMGRLPSRSRWAMARRAHLEYKRFENMSDPQRREAILAFDNAPWEEGCLPSRRVAS